MTARDNAVETREQNDVLFVSMNRPERLNAVSEELYQGIADALEHAADAGISVVVLRGNGRAFCAGADLKAHAAGRTRHQQRVYVLVGQLVGRLIEAFPGVVVSSVHGYAIGAGAELALAGDLLYVTDDAQLRFPEVELATYFGGGATQRLPQSIGAGRARELLLTGRPMSGTEAAALGLAAASLPTQAALAARVDEVAGLLAQRSKASLVATKQQLAGDSGQALWREATTTLSLMRRDQWRAEVQRFVAPGGR